MPEREDPAERGDWFVFISWRWTGGDPHKGIGVFTQNDITVTDIIELIEADHFFHVETEIMDVLAVWTMNNKRNPR